MKKVKQFAERLRDDPGRWQPWPTDLTPGSASVTAWKINADQINALPANLFQARCMVGRCYVRARKIYQ
jgi:hypothetical protein